MKILVTGGCGFVFSNFIKYMLEKHPNYEIINLDALTYAGNLNNTKELIKNPRYTFVKGNICNKFIVEKLVKKVDVVINGAAEAHVDRSISDSIPFVKTDVLGVATLLDAVRKFKPQKFIQISTDEVYGHIQKGSFNENDKLSPRNPYAASKAAAEMLAMSYFETYNIPLIITRSSNNYGYNHHPEKFIPKTIIYAILNRKIPIYGNGKNVRDWLFVLDNCEAIDKVMHNGQIGEVYNIAGKQELENIDVVKMILKILNKEKDLMEFVKDRPGHDLRYSMNIDKIRKIGWKPNTEFVEGIRKTISWYQKNRLWWEEIIKKQQIDFHQNF